MRNNGLSDATRAVAGAAAPRLSNRRRRRGPDVIYVPWLNALMSEPGLFCLDAPVVTSCRGALVTIAPWDPNRLEYRGELAKVFDRSTLVHCVSEDILNEATDLGLHPSKGRVIHPAVSPSMFQPAARAVHQDGPIRVVGVGSLIWRKDYEHALVALRQAIDAGADITFEVVGDGQDAQHLRYTIDDLDLGHRVSLIGRLPPDGVAAALQRADVFLHSSSAEGVSNAVLEAMATGLAVVTTDAGGMSEAVRDGVDGYVVPVRGVTEMAEALVRLAGDQELRDRMGSAGRKRVRDDFRLDQQVAAFAALLHEAAGR